ncbi:hypothetical protein [Teredinibacter purpureus]|uniref:hypothetical protein n=1 Tax=Teredinibacter purpureus TaxID=2731756 RepID=UPI0005F7B95A|nr:hypothetical protein [Teredinibacter purpureus]
MERGSLLSLIAACLFSFYVATDLIPKSPGWWAIEYDSWRRHAVMNTRTEIQEGNEWFLYVDTFQLEIIKNSELDGWFIGWVIAFGIMLCYWEVFFYPLFGLYK